MITRMIKRVARHLKEVRALERAGRDPRTDVLAPRSLVVHRKTRSMRAMSQVRALPQGTDQILTTCVVRRAAPGVSATSQLG